MHSGPGYGLHTIAWPPLAALIKYAHLPGFYQIPTSWPPCNPTAPSTNKKLLSSPTRRAYQYSSITLCESEVGDCAQQTWLSCREAAVAAYKDVRCQSIIVIVSLLT